MDYLLRSLRGADPAVYRHDGGRDPARALCLAHGNLDDARHHVTEMACHVTHAHDHLGRLGIDLPKD